MVEGRSKLRIVLLVLGVVLFSIYGITTLIESKVNEDLISFQFFKKQVEIQRYKLVDGCILAEDSRNIELYEIINEMDLSYYVFGASTIFSIYRYINPEISKSMDIIENQWELFFELFNAADITVGDDTKKALLNVHNELNYIETILYNLNSRWKVFYFSILTITITFFIYLLINIYLFSKTSITQGEYGVDRVRNALLHGQEQERLRISLELHDKVAQDLFACRMIINDITTTTENPGILSSFTKSLSLLDSSIQEVRDLSYSLRPPALQAIGLDSAIQSYIDNFSKKVEIPITFKAIGISNKKIDEIVSINLYRILQETLNNTAKHAHAEKIDVKLLYTYPYLLLKIDDNGVGFRYSKSEMKAKGRNKLGLPGIYERVSLLGGELIINTGKGEGTKILIKVPLEGNEKI